VVFRELFYFTVKRQLLYERAFVFRRDEIKRTAANPETFAAAVPAV
jgi:hypothetical protein